MHFCNAGYYRNFYERDVTGDTVVSSSLCKYFFCNAGYYRDFYERDVTGDNVVSSDLCKCIFAMLDIIGTFMKKM